MGRTQFSTPFKKEHCQQHTSWANWFSINAEMRGNCWLSMGGKKEDGEGDEEMLIWYFNGEQRYRSLFEINLHKEKRSRMVNG